MKENKEKKSYIVSIRLTESQYNEIQKMAEKADRSMADFIRLSTLKYIAIKKESENI